jgi:hypothetical protein
MMAQPAKTIALQVRRGTMAAIGAKAEEFMAGIKDWFS